MAYLSVLTRSGLQALRVLTKLREIKLRVSPMKTCSKCGLIKELSEFHKDKNQNDGFKKRCIKCRKEDSYIYDLKRTEKKKEYHKNYYNENSKIIKQRTIKYRLNNIDIISEKLKIYYINNSEKIKKSSKTNRCLNIEHYKLYAREYQRNRRNNDISYKLLCICRKRTNQAIKSTYKRNTTIELLGCSHDFLRTHIEKQFKFGMNWNNYGIGGWEIDHIKPCALFDLKDPEQQKQCFHYTNLQPLWAKENLSKGKKFNQ